MNKLKNSFSARYIAVLLAVVFGTAAVVGIFITIFTLDMELYQTPLNTVISHQTQDMQSWYSAKIFSKFNKLPHKDSAQTIQAELDNYLHTDNFEFGIIHADTLDHVNLSSTDSYIYQNFSDTTPEQDSYCMPFCDIQDFDPGDTPKLLKALLSPYRYPSYFTYEGEPKAGSVYWIVSNVKNPIDETGSDIFSQQKKLLTSLYHFRYTFILLSIFFAILFLVFTGFCCYSAGKNSPVTWRHKSPLILNLCFNLGITGICATLITGLLGPLLHGNFSFGFLGILFTLLTAIGILAIIFLLMNLAVRRQAGILWKYTLTRVLCLCIYNFFHGIYKFFHHIHNACRENTSLLFKSSIIITAISFLELLILCNTRGNEALFMYWLAFKFIEIPLIFTFLIQMKRLQDGSRRMAGGDLDTKIDTHHMFFEFKRHGEYLNQIQEGMSIALKEQLKSEHFKTELITNVSHDIKTPLTSLINYVDLLQKKNNTDEQRNEYLSVLERQAARLKKLIEDLIEASKASTGNLTVNMETCNIQILLTQTTGEFEEKINANQLDLVIREPGAPVNVLADNRYLWRIFDNLMNNICKYTQPDTRVYIDLETDNKTAHIIFRNISRYPLDFSGDELMERFVRGDVSRNTEGNGLGLSIARSLAESMKGSLNIYTDGDLFKVVVSFPLKRD